MKTHKRIEKTILTTQGPLSFARYVLRPADNESKRRLLQLEGIKSIAPLDCALRIDRLPFKISVDMMLEIAYHAIKMDSYQEAEDIISKHFGVKVNDDTARLVTNHIGQMVFQEDCRLADEAASLFEKGLPEYRPTKDGILYLEMDGAALNTRTKDENNSTWRENKLAVAFTDKDFYSWKGRDNKYRHQLMRREYVSLIGTASEFRKHLLALAIRNGYGTIRETVILSDGATWIRNIKEELFPDAQQILDLFHLKENIHEFSKVIFRQGEEEPRLAWAKDICSRLEDGKWTDVLQELEKYRDSSFPSGIVNPYTYIYNNRNNIDYPAYKLKGYAVGSGAIESSNKVVLQSRLKLAGMRWNVDTAQYVLSLKAKEKSGLWYSHVVPLVKKSLG